MISTCITETQQDIPWITRMEESEDQPVEIDPEFIFFLEEIEHK